MLKFIETYGKAILITLSAVAVAVIAFVVIAEVQGNRKDRALIRLEELEQNTDEDDALVSFDSLSAGALEVEQLSRDAYIRNRVQFLTARALWNDKQYREAAEGYLQLAEGVPETHFGQVSYFNAAIAYEQDGDAERAMAILEQALSEYEFSTNPLLPRMLLNLGRLYEMHGDTARATEYYNTLIQNHSGNAFVNLAYDRLISIENSN